MPGDNLLDDDEIEMDFGHCGRAPFFAGMYTGKLFELHKAIVALPSKGPRNGRVRVELLQWIFEMMG